MNYQEIKSNPKLALALMILSIIAVIPGLSLLLYSITYGIFPLIIAVLAVLYHFNSTKTSKTFAVSIISIVIFVSTVVMTVVSIMISPIMYSTATEIDPVYLDENMTALIVIGVTVALNIVLKIVNLVLIVLINRDEKEYKMRRTMLEVEERMI